VSRNQEWIVKYTGDSKCIPESRKADVGDDGLPLLYAVIVLTSRNSPFLGFMKVKLEARSQM
jgi:hypothetical protein